MPSYRSKSSIHPNQSIPFFYYLIRQINFREHTRLFDDIFTIDLECFLTVCHRVIVPRASYAFKLYLQKVTSDVSERNRERVRAPVCLRASEKERERS